VLPLDGCAEAAQYRIGFLRGAAQLVRVELANAGDIPFDDKTFHGVIPQGGPLRGAGFELVWMTGTALPKPQRTANFLW
jgi:hypothetical protein